MNTHTLSRRIVAAIDPDGTRWPKWHRNDASDGSLMLCTNVPDLAQPENLHLLCAVADATARFGDYAEFPVDVVFDFDVNAFVCTIWPISEAMHISRHAPTRSDAVLAAVCAALGIEQETTHAD